MKKYFRKLLSLAFVPLIICSCNEKQYEDDSSTNINQNESDIVQGNNNNDKNSNDGGKENNAVSTNTTPVEIVKTSRFEFSYRAIDRVVFLNSNEDYVSFCDNVSEIYREAFITAFKDEINSFNFDLYSFMVCRFNFSSSEEDIRLISLSYDEAKYYVTFETKTPDAIDEDYRTYCFLSQISKESLNKLANKEWKYVIHNLLGGEGSAYYH